ncbi:hypothetical protein [Peterkaempfera sp. SMS 1(5)a]|uniref:hypothetical protein n=1 Tax=Peterkaempfera podocarpi TaxID=3232308 RepID=UPI00366C0567
MVEDVRDGLIRVVHVEQMFALLMATGGLLSLGVLLALGSTPHQGEALAVGTVAVTLACLVMLPLCFCLPGRLRRKYEHAVPVDRAAELIEGQEATRRLSLRRLAGLMGLSACWMLLVGLVSHEVMPPVMLIVLAVGSWGRSWATAGWELENRVTLWQDVPGLLGSRGRGPVFRAPLGPVLE